MKPDLISAPTETIRHLATIGRIESIRDIADADAIVCARVRGWDVVVKQDEFVAGDPCPYVEIDSLILTADPGSRSSPFAVFAPTPTAT